MRRLLVCGVVAALSPLAQAADLARFFTQVETMHSRFVQVVHNRHGGVVSRGRGQFWLSRPGRFRWDYARPYHEQIVGHAQTVWLYDPGLAQATRYTLSEALGRTPALLLAGRGHLKRLFKVTHMAARDHLVWLRLVPRGRDQGFLWIKLGYRGVRIRRLVLRDNMGQTTDIRLTHLVLNPRLPASLFHFHPPAHTAVVRE